MMNELSIKFYNEIEESAFQCELQSHDLRWLIDALQNLKNRIPKSLKERERERQDYVLKNHKYFNCKVEIPDLTKEMIEEETNRCVLEWELQNQLCLGDCKPKLTIADLETKVFSA